MAVALRDLERGHAGYRPDLRVVHSGPPAPPTPTPVYWRRRMVVLVLVVLVVAGVSMVGRSVAGPAVPAARIEMTVTMSTGDTLWDLARHYAPAGTDRASWVVDVAARNGVDPGAILPGTPLVIPVGGPQILADPQPTLVR